jgi:hypothetical protein
MPHDEIRIPNRAASWPIAPLDAVLWAPLAVRLLLGATPVGRVIQAATLGAYAASALRDWHSRRGIRRIDFVREFGADPRRPHPMPHALREAEVRALSARLDDQFTSERIPRRELAVRVDRHLTDYIASVTGQRVRSSVEVRSFALIRVVVPFALGACDILSGDVALFKDVGPFEPHVIAHEFSHRKGYWTELAAQALAYLSLTASGEPALVQSALLERFHRTLRVLSGYDEAAFRRLVDATVRRQELRAALGALRPLLGPVARRAEEGMRNLYDGRMRLTGQAGIRDYDLGFTNFLYTFETSVTARQTPPAAGRLHHPAPLPS